MLILDQLSVSTDFSQEKSAINSSQNYLIGTPLHKIICLHMCVKELASHSLSDHNLLCNCNLTEFMHNYIIKITKGYDG